MIPARIRAREKAERCFALARSTGFAAEMATAVARGIAIAERAGIDLNEFDIPGRRREFIAPSFGRHAAPRRYSREELNETTAAFHAHMRGNDDAMRAFEETLRRREAEVGAREGETVYDAMIRNFEAEAAAARARDEARP
ncbi:MAG: hypothetical protein ACTHM0_13525 [Sphingomonas sp.]